MSSNLNIVDSKQIKLTQDLVSMLIKKPLLTKKLLNRPPFKFLHDIVTNIIDQTSYLKGLYTDHELISENVKDKESKIKFLEKLINVLGFISGTVLDVKATKIVAGLEPDKTNQLLQTLAQAAINKTNFESAVSRTLKGEKPINLNGSSTANKSEKKKKSLPSNIQNAQVNNQVKAQLSIASEKKNESQIKTNVKTQMKINKNADIKPVSKGTKSEQNKDKLVKENEIKKLKEFISEEDAKALTPFKKSVDSEQIDTSITKNEDKILQKPKSRPSTSIANNHTERPARPATARSAPSRIVTKKTFDQVLELFNLNQEKFLTSAKPVENVISENDAEKNGDDMFLVSDSVLEEDQILTEKVFDEVKKGKLVKQLVETKKELEGSEKDVFQNDDNNLTKLATRDIFKLKENIQNLTRLTTPLGRILDYVQEDIDSMILEFRSWQTEYKANIIKLKENEIAIDKELDPLLSQLEKIEQEIKNIKEKIRSKKARIIKNEEKINRMISVAVEKN